MALANLKESKSISMKRKKVDIAGIDLLFKKKLYILAFIILLTTYKK